MKLLDLKRVEWASVTLCEFEIQIFRKSARPAARWAASQGSLLARSPDAGALGGWTFEASSLWFPKPRALDLGSHGPQQRRRALGAVYTVQKPSGTFGRDDQDTHHANVCGFQLYEEAAD